MKYLLILFIIYIGVTLGITLGMTNFGLLYAQLPAAFKNNNATTNSTNSTNSTTNANVAPYMGYHYEYNFY